MKKRFKREDLSVQSPAEPDVAGLIDKMQQQLFSLENKIDILINQSPKPSRPFNRPRRHSEGRSGGSFRETKLYQAICADCNRECEVPFKPNQDRPVYCKECFSSRKGGGDSFKGKQERRFDKQEHGENRGFGQKKNPFSFRSKKRK